MELRKSNQVTNHLYDVTLLNANSIHLNEAINIKFLICLGCFREASRDQARFHVGLRQGLGLRLAAVARCQRRH
jgi:hypothetical protein